MIHLSGAFSFQRPGPVEGRLGEVAALLPAAIYISMMLLNDDGTAAVEGNAEGDVPSSVTAFVVLSQPQRVGVALDLNLDQLLAGYLGVYAVIDFELWQLPADWLPLAVVIEVNELPVGVITAAPEPIAVTGIAPPIPTGTRRPS